METSIEQVLTILYILCGWCTISTVMLILARRDVIIGLKKWVMIKLRRSPLKLRFHGPDKTVTTHIIATAGKGERVSIGEKKLVFFKTKEGSTFFLDEKSIRRGDDGVNEISYNYKSIMPLNPGLSEAEAELARQEVVNRIEKSREDSDGKKGYTGVQMENLAQYTDPKRLNRLIEFIKLAAKTDALGKMNDLEKYVKWSLYAAIGAAAVSIIVWYTMTDKVVPMLTIIQQAVKSVGSAVINL